MAVFKKKCGYCKKKIKKGQEILKDVKDPVFVGTKQKAFCCDKHAESYEEESANAKKCESGCCG